MSGLILPLSITGKKELIKVQRELEHIGEMLIQNKVSKEQIGEGRNIPQLSDVANEFLFQNELKLDSQNVQKIVDELQHIKDSSPMLRVSFAVEPERSVIKKVVAWFRKEIDPTLLIQVGIQPSIAGGCIVQTPSQRYDFSLRKHILGSTDKFRKVIARDVFHKDVETETTEKSEQLETQAAPQEQPTEGETS